MLTIRDVLQRNHPLTDHEYSIIMAAWMAAITAVGVVLLVICMLLSEPTEEVAEIFFTINGVTVAAAIWGLLLLMVFLSGVHYLHRHNRAVQYGELHEGHVVEHEQCFVGARSPMKHKYKIRLEDGTVIRSPSFVDVPDPFRSCSVYYYKRRYYLTGFQW